MLSFLCQMLGLTDHRGWTGCASYTESGASLSTPPFNSVQAQSEHVSPTEVRLKSKPAYICTCTSILFIQTFSLHYLPSSLLDKASHPVVSTRGQSDKELTPVAKRSPGQESEQAGSRFCLCPSSGKDAKALSHRHSAKLCQDS